MKMRSKRSWTSKTCGTKLICPPKKIGQAIRVVGWNVLLLIGGLTLIAVIGEIYLRLTRPFAWNNLPTQFVPGVGVIRKPDAEMRYTNGVDFWTVSRTNSLGFLDRPALDPEHAAESCHITMIGDSFVEALEVPISDKFHVRLEEMAAREVPHLNVTTSAFGISATGQIDQLPFYDKYARRLRPKLLVLVFVYNDFPNNVENLPRRGRVTVTRDENGTLKLRVPDQNSPDPLESSGQVPLLRHAVRLVNSAPFLNQDLQRLVNVIRTQYLLRWWNTKIQSMVNRINARWTTPYSGESSDARTIKLQDIATDFALGQFKERAGRDGTSLVIFASYTLQGKEGRRFERMNVLARKYGIPVVDQYDYIIRRGGRVEDVHWPHDEHWNPIGHQRAAEAILEYLKQNQKLCDGR